MDLVGINFFFFRFSLSVNKFILALYCRLLWKTYYVWCVAIMCLLLSVTLWVFTQKCTNDILWFSNCIQVSKILCCYGLLQFVLYYCLSFIFEEKNTSQLGYAPAIPWSMPLRMKSTYWWSLKHNFFTICFSICHMVLEKLVLFMWLWDFYFRSSGFNFCLSVHPQLYNNCSANIFISCCSLK